MAPKKGQKMSLNEFLGDSALGSWADEMDSLPSAPSTRTDDDRGDRFSGRRDDFSSSRQDRIPREDLPLPSQPPYTAFIGNLAFDITDMELGEFFGQSKIKSVKIIKDRDEKPKGFGYVEFVDLEALKESLTRTGSNFAGRTIRVSVAEPPKERSGFGGFDDDAKFSGAWRREGPLPDLSTSRDSSRRRFDGPADRISDRPSSTSESISDWRSSRPARPSAVPVEQEAPSSKRRTSGFFANEGHGASSDAEEVWAIGSKFKPSSEDGSSGKMGTSRGRNDMGPPKESAITEEADWRSSVRPKPVSRDSSSPSNSTPPTPQMGRRKLELLPRTANTSTSPSPLASPKTASSSIGATANRSNPFGAAKPVDVTARENAVTQRIEKEREATKERLSHPMSRTSSRTASIRTKTPPPVSSIASSSPSTPGSPRSTNTPSHSTVRPAISFADAASTKKDTGVEEDAESTSQGSANHVAEITSQVSEVTI